MYGTSFFLTPEQARRLNQRNEREFLPSTAERNLITTVEAAYDIREIERILMNNKLCDYADFSGACIEASVMFAKVMIKTSYRFPKIRSRFCFVGTRLGYMSTMQKLCENNRAVMRQFEIEDICPTQTIIELACNALMMLHNTPYNGMGANVLATAFSFGGILDALVIDEADFNQLGYQRLSAHLRNQELSGQAPKGCGKPASVIYHECGHLLDYLCKMTDDIAFINFFRSFSYADIVRNVSQYGTTSIQEFFAEAFSEYMCSYAPRETARSVYHFITQKYRNL